VSKIQAKGRFDATLGPGSRPCLAVYQSVLDAHTWWTLRNRYS